MESCQIYSFMTLVLLYACATLSKSQPSLTFSTNQRDPSFKEGNIHSRPAMAPIKQLKKPVELMSQSEYKVTKLKDDKERYMRYGGQTTVKTPKKLTVTDELFFEVEIEDFHGPGESLRGNITIACFGGLTPMTCLNFVSITKGYRKGKRRLSYKDGTVSKIVRDFMIQMGEIKEGDNDSIFGKNFADESFAISHNQAGWVGMANFGQDSNGSQFYILLKTARWLDGKHVIFAKVTKGMDFVKKIGEQDTDGRNAPLKRIKIVNCGSLDLEMPYVMEESQYGTDGDIERVEGDEMPQ